MRTKLFLRKNAPIIFSIISIGGLIATVITTAKAAPKAKEALQRKEEEKGEALTRKEKFLTAAPIYIPTAVVFLGTATGIACAAAFGEKKSAALCTGYALAAKQFRDYTTEVRKTYGEEAHREIMRKITTEECAPVPVQAIGGFFTSEFHLPEDRETKLFYDAIKEKWFETPYEDVLQALYHLNRNFVLRGYAPLDKYYEFLGVKTEQYEDGWAIDPDNEFYFLDFDIYKTVTDDGLEYYTIEPMFMPTPDFAIDIL